MYSVTIHHPDLLQQLREEKFDAALAEVLDHCGVGLFHLIGIEKYAIVQSLMAAEGFFAMTGAPSAPSYTPGLAMPFSERMSFFERLQNSFFLVVVKLYLPHAMAPFEHLFQSLYPASPPLMEIYANASLWFINSEPLIDFPKTTIHKVVDIGGISASAEHKPLNETWDKILSLRPHNLILSFGTICKSHLILSEYKAAIREAATRLPNVTFIWKYEKAEDGIDDGVENIVTASWLPQNDLLRRRIFSRKFALIGIGNRVCSDCLLLK